MIKFHSRESVGPFAILRKKSLKAWLSSSPVFPNLTVLERINLRNLHRRYLYYHKYLSSKHKKGSSGWYSKPLIQFKRSATRRSMCVSMCSPWFPVLHVGLKNKDIPISLESIFASVFVNIPSCCNQQTRQLHLCSWAAFHLPQVLCGGQSPDGNGNAEMYLHGSCPYTYRVRSPIDHPSKCNLEIEMSRHNTLAKETQITNSEAVGLFTAGVLLFDVFFALKKTGHFRPIVYFSILNTFLMV